MGMSRVGAPILANMHTSLLHIPRHPYSEIIALDPLCLAGDFVVKEIEKVDTVNEVDDIKLDENDLLTDSMEKCELRVGDRVLRDEYEKYGIWRVGTVTEVAENGDLTIQVAQPLTPARHLTLPTPCLTHTHASRTRSRPHFLSSQNPMPSSPLLTCLLLLFT